MFPGQPSKKNLKRSKNPCKIDSKSDNDNDNESLPNPPSRKKQKKLKNTVSKNQNSKKLNKKNRRKQKNFEKFLEKQVDVEFENETSMKKEKIEFGETVHDLPKLDLFKKHSKKKKFSRKIGSDKLKTMKFLSKEFCLGVE